MDDDARLLARFLDGEEAAFEELVVRYEARVRNLVLGLLRDPALAEDVAQETFLTAYRKAESFRGEGSFRGWLFRIAVHRARDELRRRKRRGEVELEDVHQAPAQELDSRFRLAHALSSLRPEYRTVMILREVEGLSYREIGEALGWPLGTVETRIHRARLELRDLLQGAGSTDGDREGQKSQKSRKGNTNQRGPHALSR